MINIGAKTSAGNNFNSKAAPAAALARMDGPRIEQKSSQLVPFPLVSVTDPEGSTFES